MLWCECHVTVTMEGLCE